MLVRRFPDGKLDFVGNPKRINPLCFHLWDRIVKRFFKYNYCELFLAVAVKFPNLEALIDQNFFVCILKRVDGSLTLQSININKRLAADRHVKLLELMSIYSGSSLLLKTSSPAINSASLFDYLM